MKSYIDKKEKLKAASQGVELMGKYTSSLMMQTFEYIPTGTLEMYNVVYTDLKKLANQLEQDSESL